MDRGLAVLCTALVGGLIALQPPINAGLGRATGSLPAALVSFAVGTLVLALIVARERTSRRPLLDLRRALVLPDRRAARGRVRHRGV